MLRCGSSKFFHCEPSLQLLCLCTIIQNQQKVPHFCKIPILKRARNLSKQDLSWSAGEAWPGDKIQSKITSWHFCKLHPVQCSCPSDMFEDEVTFWTSWTIFHSNLPDLLKQLSNRHRERYSQCSFRNLFVWYSSGHILSTFSQIRAGDFFEKLLTLSKNASKIVFGT